MMKALLSKQRGRMRQLITQIYSWLQHVTRILIGFSFLLITFFTIIIPSSPLLAALFTTKYMEQLFYRTLYNATVVSSNGFRIKDRIILIVLNSRVSVCDLRELFIQNVLDLHGPDGELEFPNVTRRIQQGWFHEYWVEEKKFDISQHIKSVGLESEEYTVHDIPKLLSTIQKEKQVDFVGSQLSPWSIHTAQLTSNRCAVMFKMNVALNYVEILRALMSSIEGSYERRLPKNKLEDLSIKRNGLVRFVTHIALAGWILLSFTINKLSNMDSFFKQKGTKDNKRVYFCSKRLNATSFQQIGRQCGVSSRYIVLANLVLVLEELISSGKSLALTSYENGADLHEIYIRLQQGKLENSIRKKNLEKFIQSLKYNTYLDPSPCQTMFHLFKSKFCSLFVPSSILPTLAYSSTKADVRLDMNTFDLDTNARLMGRRVQSLSVWNQQSDTQGMLKVTVTDCMDSLIISTVCHHSKEELALKILKRFYELHCEMVKAMDDTKDKM